jgi:hypothetical protein
MPKILLVANQGSTSPQLISALRVSTGRSLADLQAAMKAGRPFFAGELFMNDHVEIDKQLRGIIQAFHSFGATMEVYELQPNEDFDACPREVCRIDVATLLNILDQASGKYT